MNRYRVVRFLVAQTNISVYQQPVQWSSMGEILPVPTRSAPDARRFSQDLLTDPNSAGLEWAGVKKPISCLYLLARPVGRFYTELLGVLSVQPLPAELHRLTTNDTADGSSAEKVIQNIETNVPPGSTH